MTEKTGKPLTTPEAGLPFLATMQRLDVSPNIELVTKDGTQQIQLTFPPADTVVTSSPQEMVDLAFSLLAKCKEAGLDLGDDSEPPWTKERMLLLIEKLHAIIYTFLSGTGTARQQPVEKLNNVQPIRHQNPEGLLMHMQHCLWMLTEMPKFVETNRVRKFNRWLSDIGGVLRTLGIVTLDDLRILFAPEGAEINHART